MTGHPLVAALPRRQVGAQAGPDAATPRPCWERPHLSRHSDNTEDRPRARHRSSPAQPVGIRQPATAGDDLNSRAMWRSPWQVAKRTMWTGRDVVCCVGRRIPSERLPNLRSALLPLGDQVVLRTPECLNQLVQRKPPAIGGLGRSVANRNCRLSDAKALLL
jgi:hypothetical protein